MITLLAVVSFLPYISPEALKWMIDRQTKTLIVDGQDPEEFQQETINVCSTGTSVAGRPYVYLNASTYRREDRHEYLNILHPTE